MLQRQQQQGTPLLKLNVNKLTLMCCLQVLTFTSSLFGDLIESIMKRDAGLKVSLTQLADTCHCSNCCIAAAWIRLQVSLHFFVFLFLEIGQVWLCRCPNWPTEQCVIVCVAAVVLLCCYRTLAT